MRIIYYFSIILMMCVTGCETSSYDTPPADAHTTVNHTLPEVRDAILLSYHPPLASKSRIVIMNTNEVSGVSYTLTETESKGAWQESRTITIKATAINSAESSIAVRCITVGGGCLAPFPVSRHRIIERHTLSEIVKTLNRKP